jgi:ATP-dependent DNA helicase RecG
MDIVQYLRQNVASQKGIGEKYAAALQKYFARGKVDGDAGAILADLLMHLPYDYDDRKHLSKLSNAKSGYHNLAVKVLQHIPPPTARSQYASRSKAIYRVQCEADGGSLMLTFFKAEAKYLLNMLPVNESILIAGHLQLYDGMWQITHPEIIGKASEAAELLKGFEPIYPATEGISSKMFARLIKQILSNLPETDEWLLSSSLQKNQWIDFTDALKIIHQPENLSDVACAKSRLAYDEGLAQQLSLRLIRMQQQKVAGKRIALLDNPMVQQAISNLPFQLTEGQLNVLSDINADMMSGNRMLRLLQGDVGSGKTIIAAIAMLAAIHSGKQAAIMAPTEILARQHYDSISELLKLKAIEAIDGFPIIFLAGSLNASARSNAYQQIKTAPTALIIGTHALFQDAVEFNNLGLAIIDEQHRFGVAQRLALSEKNKDCAPHLLLMTATPIPRSLAMANYGDMDISLLKQKPAGRQIIDTRTIALSRINEVIDGVVRALEVGEKLYWICPLVEELEEATLQSSPQMAALKAAEQRFAFLQKMFGVQVGMIHGRMNMNERETVMQAFYRSEIRLLVATTVVEVGVNVPDATIMIIENAERFGLAQLHQLRGRVGRSNKQSRCLLLYDDKCSESARTRLKTMRDTNDGFVIAEADWSLRGSGDLLGLRQTGAPDFTFLNLDENADLLKAANQEAQIQLEKYNGNITNTPLANLLKIFGYDKSYRFLLSG